MNHFTKPLPSDATHRVRRATRRAAPDANRPDGWDQASVDTLARFVRPDPGADRRNGDASAAVRPPAAERDRRD